MNDKKLLSINIENDIVDVVDEIVDKYDVVIRNYGLYKILIDNNDDDIKFDIIDEIENNYNVIVEFKYIDDEINDKKYVEFELIDRLYYPFIYNKDLLIEIFDENINTIENNFNDVEFDKNLINDSIDIIFDRNDNKLSFYDIIKLFEFIVDDIKRLNKENEIEFENYKPIENYELIELFKYVVDDLNKLNPTFNSSNKFKLSLINNYPFNLNILDNKHYCIDNYTFYDEIDENYIYDDLINNIDDELIKLLNIDYDNFINTYVFFENNYINNINYDIGIDINYVVKYKDKINYEIDENYIELSIDDILSILYQISNYNDVDDLKIIDYNLIDNIDELFENLNNSYDDYEFIDNLFDNEFELLFDDYYELFYYTINNNKIGSIFDLRYYVLNYLSNLNLNKSFKFDDELYNII